MHVEFYPSHARIPTNGVVDDLLSTLAHAQGGTSADAALRSSFSEIHLRRPYLERFNFPLLGKGKRTVHETDQTISGKAYSRWSHHMRNRSFEQLHRCVCRTIVGEKNVAADMLCHSFTKVLKPLWPGTLPLVTGSEHPQWRTFFHLLAVVDPVQNPV